ncbi:Protein O-mannosyltransferase 2 [Mortierella sp. GBA35]|nr:Protein O-mannosyltransferase 2 [Mortierella sp. GBA35]
MTSELRNRYSHSSRVTETWKSSSLAEIDDDYPVKPHHHSKVARIVEACSSTVLTAILTGLSAWTRYRDILSTNNVTWDEAHFGKFGSQYIRGEHYFDVHPPLAKMLVGLSGVMAGYDGSFNFESGANYPDINYRFMCLFNATFGVVMVPLAFWTARELHMSRTAATFAAAMVLMDNAYVTISRYILLDSMLLSPTLFVVFCLTKFRNVRDRAFSAKWWIWLSLMGLGIGAVSGVKWVGLFVTAFVGLDLWDLLGDLHISMSIYVMHWIALSICLIAVPVSIYVVCFVAHFRILTNSGPGDAYMSSLFQANLNGTDFSKNPLEVAYGSLVTIKSSSHGGGLLHSHKQTYPLGSKQQQVTTYNHKDNNNEWTLARSRNANNVNKDEIQILKHGDILRLVHNSTGRNLHTHRVRAPTTTTQLEVSGYGFRDLGDGNDEWVLEIVGEDAKLPKDGTLRSLTTKFVLRHRTFGCLLASDPDKEDHLASKPSQWPFLAIGLRMNKWTDNSLKIYLLGNPIVWWSGTVSLAAFLLTLAYYTISRSRHQLHEHHQQPPLQIQQSTNTNTKKSMSSQEWDRFLFAGKVTVGGWFLHYLPFLIMGRVMYLHHYFPALYFTILLCAYLFDNFLSRTQNRLLKVFVWSIAYSAVTLAFIWFWPASYGIHGPAAESMTNRQWCAAWDIVDPYKPRTFI